MITIIIPTCGEQSQWGKLVSSIEKYTTENIDIMVVQNGVPSPYKDGMAFEQNVDGRMVSVLNFKEKLGFAKAVNEGIKRAHPKSDIIILNDDVLLLDQQPNQWIGLLCNPMINNFDSSRRIGITAPMLSSVMLGGEATGVDVRYALFWCVYIHRAVIDDIGLLDESLWSYYEDMDFCIRAKLKGWETICVSSNNSKDETKGFVVGSFPIYHEGGKTHKQIQDIDKHISDNYKKVVSKYNSAFQTGLVAHMILPPKVGASSILKYEDLLEFANPSMVKTHGNLANGNIDISKANLVEGYMSPLELATLSMLSFSCEEGAAFLEVGSWLGRSSKAISDHLPVFGKLICVDTWNGTENEGMAHGKARDKMGDRAFFDFIRNNGDNLASIIPLRMRSENAYELLKEIGVKVDVAFIDADHSFEAVVKDIQSVKPLLKTGESIICGHDYSNDWQGVISAVKQCFSNFSVIEGTSIWIARKKDIIDC